MIILFANFYIHGKSSLESCCLISLKPPCPACRNSQIGFVTHFVLANKTYFYQEVYIIKYLRKREDKSGLTFFGLYFLFLTIQILQLKYLLTFEVWGRSGYIFSQGPHEKKCETEHSANLHPVFIFTFPWHLVFTWCRCIDLFTAVKAYSFAFIESRTSTFVLKTVSSTKITWKRNEKPYILHP